MIQAGITAVDSEKKSFLAGVIEEDLREATDLRCFQGSGL